MGKAGQLAFLVGEVLAAPCDYSWLAPDRPLFQCQGRRTVVEGPKGERLEFWPCGRLLPDRCFRPKPQPEGMNRVNTVHWRPVQSRCVACEQNINDANKRLWRFEYKAGNVLGDHMRKERREGLHRCRRLAEYERLTGLTRLYLAAQMRASAAQDDECPHCDRPWSAMPGGWEGQMSVDRPDTTRLLGRDNWMLQCRTGNSQDARTDPRTRQIRRAYWRAIREEERGAA